MSDKVHAHGDNSGSPGYVGALATPEVTPGTVRE